MKFTIPFISKLTSPAVIGKPPVEVVICPACLRTNDPVPGAKKLICKHCDHLIRVWA